MIKGLKSACPGVSTEKWRPGQQKRTACGAKGENRLALRVSHVTLICFCMLNYSFSKVFFFLPQKFQMCFSDSTCHWSLGTDFWKVLENLSKTQIKDISTGSGMYCHKPSQVRIIFCHSRRSSSAFSELRNLVSFMEHDSADLHSAVSCGLWSVLFHWKGTAVLLQQGTTALQRFRIIFFYVTSILIISGEERILVEVQSAKQTYQKTKTHVSYSSLYELSLYYTLF